MSVSMKSHLDMFCDSYFNDTPPSDWSYLSFLETLKPELHSLGGVPFLLRGMGCRSYNVISCFEQLGGCRSYPGDGCRS
ncbi:unnamed protein product [Rhizophagus irregularis]|nr:unnamed protein product [Rhizophagus irregularis]